MSVAMAAALFGANPTTVLHWIDGTTPTPRWAKMHLRALNMLSPPRLLRMARIGFTVKPPPKKKRKPKKRRRRK